MKPIIYCKWQKAVEKQAKEEKAQQAQDLANARAAEPPVWERYVTNTELTRHNRAAVADEIRRQDGEGAAERFLIEKRLKDLDTHSVVHGTELFSIYKPQIMNRLRNQSA